MKILTVFLFAVFSSLLPAFAQDDAKSTAQSFYDGYMKVLSSNGDTKAYVLKAASLTDGFKTAYKKFMKEADFDPIINAQDYPDAGFVALKAKADGDNASLVMKSRDPSFNLTIELGLVKEDGSWKINRIGDVKAK